MSVLGLSEKTLCRRPFGKDAGTSLPPLVSLAGPGGMCPSMIGSRSGGLTVSHTNCSVLWLSRVWAAVPLEAPREPILSEAPLAIN